MEEARSADEGVRIKLIGDLIHSDSRQAIARGSELVVDAITADGLVLAGIAVKLATSSVAEILDIGSGLS